MFKLLKYKLLFIFLLALSSCNSDKNITDVTYFGGKIINPTSKQVFFYKGDQRLDSAKLSKERKFLFKFDSIRAGLYTFKHGTEIQFLFLEPNDSLLLRLNTWDFDESLVFSGKGSEKNNLLMNLFLQNEKEDKFMRQYYTLSDSLFELKIDSLLQLKKLLFKHYKEESVAVSSLFEKYIEAAINFPLYKKKEIYPYRHKKELKLTSYPKIDPRFYKFRKGIDFNDEDLQDFYAFDDYLRYYLTHISYEKLILNEGSNMNSNFVAVTANHLTSPKIKDRFLREGMWSVLLDEKISLEEKKKAEKLFFENCSDTLIKNSVKKLIEASNYPQIGADFPTIEVFNMSDENHTINDISKDHNSVVYFWPKGQRQIEYLAKRIKYLEKKHPDLIFIGIDAKNVDYNWKSYVKANKFNQNKQFRLNKKSELNDWIQIDYSRAILVDKNGIVKNGFTYLMNPNIETQLTKLKNN